MKGISHRDLKPENLLLDRFYNLQIAGQSVKQSVNNQLSSQLSSQSNASESSLITQICNNGHNVA